MLVSALIRRPGVWLGIAAIVISLGIEAVKRLAIQQLEIGVGLIAAGMTTIGLDLWWKHRKGGKTPDTSKASLGVGLFVGAALVASPFVLILAALELMEGAAHWILGIAWLFLFLDFWRNAKLGPTTT